MPFCLNASHFAPFLPFSFSGNPEVLLFLLGSVSHHRACFFSLGKLFLTKFYPVPHVPLIPADANTSTSQSSEQSVWSPIKTDKDRSILIFDLPRPHHLNERRTFGNC